MSLYCKLFIETTLNINELCELVANAVGGEIKPFDTIDSLYLDIDVILNDEYDEKLKHESNGFLFYKYYLDIEPVEGTAYRDYVSQVKLLIGFLREKGFKAIPACDFEDELNEEKSYKEFM